MTSQEALAKALRAINAQMNAGITQGPANGQAQNVGQSNQQGAYDHAAHRAQQKAEIAYNTRIANERASREAAANETKLPNENQFPGFGAPFPHRTGRTTRQLMECLDRAAKGETVVFVAFNRQVIATDMALIARYAGPPRYREMSINMVANRVLFFRSGGTLTVTCDYDARKLAGQKVDHVEFDEFDHAIDSARKHSVWMDMGMPGLAKELPPTLKCVGSLKEHGPLVERWRKSLLCGSEKLLMCDACYLHAERLMSEDEGKTDDANRSLHDTAPPARTGLVPQSFGDQRIGGIWAARGMR